jgi:hypothetical protein
MNLNVYIFSKKLILKAGLKDYQDKTDSEI